MNFIKYSSAVTILFFSLFATTYAAPGDLDPTFGRVGFDTKAFSGRDHASTVLLRTDGKFLVIGTDSITFSPIITLLRYNADGTLDNSFGSGGIVQVANGAAFDAKLQSDGKIVVVGGYQVGDRLFNAVLRFNSNGDLDNTFNDDGIFTDSMDNITNAVDIQSDGKIVAVGAGRDGLFRYNYAVIRLNTNGTLDTTFDKDGIVLTPVAATNPGGQDIGYAVAVQNNGKIVIGGRSNDFTVLRYNSDGSLDTTFDSDGIAQAGFTGNTSLNSLAIDQNDAIVTTGFVNDGGTGGLAFARFAADGSLDNTFSDDGKLIAISGSNSFANDVLIQPDGKILAGGASSGVSNITFSLVRLDPNGDLDNSFGNGGVVSTQIFDGGNAIVKGIALAQDGTIFAVGSAGKTPPSTDEDFVYAKYNSDGTPSSTVGTFGYETQNILNIPERSSVAEGSATQADGKIIVVGSQAVNEDDAYGVITRFSANGRIDGSFASSSTSGTGFLTVRPGNSNTSDVTDVVIQPDGKIIGVGSFEGDTDAGLFLVRLNSNGERDLAFGGNNTGYATVGIFQGGALGRSVKLLPDGKILVAGATPNIISQTIRFAVFKFNADGTRDTSFGSSGIATTSFSSSNDLALALDVQADGKILASGGGNVDLGGGNGMLAIARFNSNGSIDNTFGTSGKIIADVGNFIDLAADIKVQADGRFAIGGASCTDSNCGGGNGFIFRYLPNGSPDTTFNSNGRVFIPAVANGLSTGVSSIGIQENGKIIGGGVIENTATLQDALLVRYNADGSIDTDFGTNGIVSSDIDNTDQLSNSIDIQADGKVVSVGSSVIGKRTDFAIWRYLASDSTFVPTSSTPFDFDGDGKTDVSIFRPNAGQWWYLRSSDFSNAAFAFGTNTDTLVPADYTGDGKTDIAFWRESTGEWFILRSEDSSFYGFPFGSSGDIPAPGDFDGDGIADAAVFRPSQAVWYIQRSSDGQTAVQQFGVAEDKPTVSDFDGDGKDDIAIYRPSVSQWWQLRSQDGVIAYQFGTTGDKTVQGDYTGDGKADVAIFRPSTGQWLILRSEDSSFFGFPFGISTDIPSPGDYDGDGIFDAAVFRPSTNTWFYNGSTSGNVQLNFGIAGDIPIPNVYSVE